MALDRAVPARFLTSAFHADDLIAIAYRRLSSEESLRRQIAQERQPSTLPTDTPSQATAAGCEPAQRPVWHHRFVRASAASSPKYLAWLRHLNAAGNDIYVSMNTFVSPKGRRTERNVHAVRHIYADFDSGGLDALGALRQRQDLPPISYVVHSSAGKFQVIWNVQSFDLSYAKRLLCHLAYTLGADQAVHDLNRVLRLPGFFNFKYSPPQFIRLEMGRILGPHGPVDFPVPTTEAAQVDRMTRDRSTPLPGTSKANSRSERDWASVRVALRAGRRWQEVVRDLVQSRQDKANPEYYAALTVLKALDSLRQPPPQQVVAMLQAARGRGPRRQD
jgi:hypothetical protein